MTILVSLAWLAIRSARMAEKNEERSWLFPQSDRNYDEGLDEVPREIDGHRQSCAAMQMSGPISEVVVEGSVVFVVFSPASSACDLLNWNTCSHTKRPKQRNSSSG